MRRKVMCCTLKVAAFLVPFAIGATGILLAVSTAFRDRSAASGGERVPSLQCRDGWCHSGRGFRSCARLDRTRHLARGQQGMRIPALSCAGLVCRSVVPYSVLSLMAGANEIMMGCRCVVNSPGRWTHPTSMGTRRHHQDRSWLRSLNRQRQGSEGL